MGRRTNLDAVDSEREQALRWLNFAWQALFSTVREHAQLQARIQIEQLRAKGPPGRRRRGRRLWKAGSCSRRPTRRGFPRTQSGWLIGAPNETTTFESDDLNESLRLATSRRSMGLERFALRDPLPRQAG
jgi:hypothetical protein